MIVYGVRETSIGGLFLAGVVPGLLMAGALMLMVRHLAIRRNCRATVRGRRALWGLPRAFWALMARSCCSGPVLGRVHADERPPSRSSTRWCWAVRLRDFRCRSARIIVDTVETTGVMMALVMSAALLAYALSISRMPQEFGAWLTATIDSKLVYLLLVNLILLVVGCFMEAIAAMLILIPILVPPAMALGIDPIQFGVIVVLNLMIGTITPPVGIVLFVTARVAELPFEKVCRATLPFLWPLLAVLAAITLVPALTTALPAALR
jgi:tripartite ATP-independent transporter DctM subunit